MDRTGSEVVANRIGLAIVSSPNNVVGGVAARSRNVISGNLDAGIHILGIIDPSVYPSDGNQVRGNYIGTDAQGQKALGNAIGIHIDGASKTTIGGTLAGTRNIISGNPDGMLITGSTRNNKVEGNYIGVDATGTKAIGNYFGINFQALGENNAVGGTTAGARNVISGNGTGIYLISGTSNAETSLKIQGNYNW
jgi:hypothetical protein